LRVRCVYRFHHSANWFIIRSVSSRSKENGNAVYYFKQRIKEAARIISECFW
jgi:hypothetical protein